MFVLAIALFTTLLMNLHLKEHPININFYFNLPELSLPNTDNISIPYPNLQNESDAIKDTSVLTLERVNQIGVNSRELFGLLAHILDPRPVFSSFSHGISTMNLFIINTANMIAFGIEQTHASVISGITFISNTIITSLNILVESIFNVILQIISSIADTIIQIGYVLQVIFNSIVTFVSHAMLVIVTKIMAFIDAFIAVITTPFKILGAFWIQIKPYADILWTHIQYSFNDLASGFASFEKIASLLSTPEE